MEASIQRGATEHLCAVGRPSIVLALRGGAYPTSSLRQARVIARKFAARLCILHVSQGSRRWAGFRLQQPANAAAPWPDYRIRDCQRTREWLQNAAATAVPLEEQVAATSGDFRAAVAAYAVQVNARLIIVPSVGEQLGDMSGSLARAAGAPVLVARESRAENRIVAATDLWNTSYPVLRHAADWGRALNAQVTALHNVQPMAAAVGFGGAWPMICLLPEDPARQVRRQHLTMATRQLMVEAETVVRDEFSATVAILKEAQRQDARLLVVGTRRRSFVERWLLGSVATDVVNRAHCSVLVAPMEGAFMAQTMPSTP